VGGDQPAVHETEVRQVAEGRAPIQAADVSILVLGLGQVRDDKGVEPFCEPVQRAIKFGADSVGRVWSQRRYDARVTAPARDELFGLGQAALALGIGGVSDVEVGVR
jgi:hypothetical protein